MTANEYIELFLLSKTENMSAQVDEKAAIEVSDLISGSFVYSLFESMEQAEFEIESLTQHLEELYDTENFYGIIYFIMLLSDATGLILPKEFYVLSLRTELVSILSSAIIEDWLEAAE